MKHPLTIGLIVFTIYVPLHSIEPKSLDAINEEIQGYIQRFPHLASISEIGKSVEERPIYCVKIHDESVKNNVTIVLNFGIHSREFASTHSGVFLIRQLLEDPGLRHQIQTTTWFVVPVLNPDGYHHATTIFGLWRKNRRRLPSSQCIGVDLNRNFPVGWDETLSTDTNVCQEDYSGQKPLSEPESRILKNLLEKVEVTDAYVDIHSCAQSILHPYGYTKKKPPEDKLRRLVEAAEDMKAAMKKIRGTDYVVQSAADLYVAGGGSDDFAFEEMKVPIVFTLELGGSGSFDDNCFHPSAEDMVVLQRECLQAMLALNRFLIRSLSTRSSRLSNLQKANEGRTIYPLLTVVIIPVLYHVL